MRTCESHKIHVNPAQLKGYRPGIYWPIKVYVADTLVTHGKHHTEIPCLMADWNSHQNAIIGSAK